uniref:Uncharacterized protein n=1 Tax=Setaria italica TaxID=4555 RepID=K3Z1V8_SETIT
MGGAKHSHKEAGQRATAPGSSTRANWGWDVGGIDRAVTPA